MTTPARDDAREVWRAARTFEELCKLGARFLEGEIAFFPGWGAPDVDEETDAIIGVLAGLCRAGFLTCASQPGHGPRMEHDGQMWRRRAFVSGFATEALARHLARRLEDRGLVLASFGADERGDPAVAMPVGRRGETPFLFSGGPAGPEELEIFDEVLAAPARAALAGTRYVSAVDPEWDDRSLLWDVLAAAIRAR